MGQTLKGKDNLTDKQRRFCEEYVIDWNATRAAIDAGYSGKTADVQGSRLLANVKVKKYIDECKEMVAELAGISALQNARWLKEIAEDKAEESKTRIKAIEVLNKMRGYDAPTKQEVSVRQEVINRPEWFDEE